MQFGVAITLIYIRKLHTGNVTSMEFKWRKGPSRHLKFYSPGRINELIYT